MKHETDQNLNKKQIKGYVSKIGELLASNQKIHFNRWKEKKQLFTDPDSNLQPSVCQVATVPLH